MGEMQAWPWLKMDLSSVDTTELFFSKKLKSLRYIFSNIAHSHFKDS